MNTDIVVFYHNFDYNNQVYLNLKSAFLALDDLLKIFASGGKFAGKYNHEYFTDFVKKTKVGLVAKVTVEDQIVGVERCCAYNGELELLKEIVEYQGFGKPHYDVHTDALAGGHIKVIEWFYHLNTDMSGFYEIAIDRKNADLIKWGKNKFSITKEHYKYAIAKGDLEILRVLAECDA